MFDFDVPCHTAEQHDAQALELIELASDPRAIRLFGTGAATRAWEAALEHMRRAEAMRVSA